MAASSAGAAVVPRDLSCVAAGAAAAAARTDGSGPPRTPAVPARNESMKAHRARRLVIAVPFAVERRDYIRSLRQIRRGGPA